MTDTEATEPENLGDDVIEVMPGSLSDDVSFARPDPYLESLVAVANNPGIGMDITLLVNGLVVVGEMIPHSMFWEEQAVAIEGWHPRPGTDDATAETALAAASAFAEIFRERAEEATALEADEPEDKFPPRFIHLRNAVVYAPGQARNVGLWRGRLSAVSGWSFGR